VLILPFPRPCSLVLSVTTPHYSTTVSRALRQPLRSRRSRTNFGECPECELRFNGVLGSSALRSTYGAKGLLRNGWRVRPDLHRVDRRAAFGQRVTREQLPHIPIVDPPLRERRTETTLAPPVHGGEAEVGRRREQAGGQDRVGPLEEGVGAAPHALVVEVSAKGSQILRGLGTRPSCFPQSSKALHVSNL
jgi:hypothetical protein